MDKPAVYCSYEALGEFCLYADKYPEWSKAISRYCHVFVDINPEVKETDEIFLTFASKRYTRSLITDEAYYLFRDIDEEDKAEAHIKSKPFSIFILNRTVDECLELSKTTGVFVISDMHLSSCNGLFARMSKHSLKQETLQKNRWQLLKIPKPLPCNGIIIIDNFLFLEKPLQNSLLSVISLIKEFYDENLEIPFQVILVFRNSSNGGVPVNLKIIEDEIINPFIQEFNERKVELGIIAHTNTDDFHKRQVISNYHLAESDRGFDAFYKNNKVKKKNDFYYSPMFGHITTEGQCEIDDMFDLLALLKKEVRAIMKTQHNGTNDVLFILGKIEHRFLE